MFRESFSPLGGSLADVFDNVDGLWDSFSGDGGPLASDFW